MRFNAFFTQRAQRIRRRGRKAVSAAVFFYFKRVQINFSHLQMDFSHLQTDSAHLQVDFLRLISNFFSLRGRFCKEKSATNYTNYTNDWILRAATVGILKKTAGNRNE